MRLFLCMYFRFHLGHYIHQFLEKLNQCYQKKLPNFFALLIWKQRAGKIRKSIISNGWNWNGKKSWVTFFALWLFVENRRRRWDVGRKKVLWQNWKLFENKRVSETLKTIIYCHKFFGSKNQWEIWRTSNFQVR